MIAPRRILILGTSYAALVDILIATMGVFVVVFTQLQIEEAPRLVQKQVDGVIVCTQENTYVLYDAQTSVERTTSTSFSALSDTIQRIWPQGANVMIGLLKPCALSPDGSKIWGLETDIRRLEEMTRSYLIEVVPLGDSAEGLGSAQRLLERWRETTPALQVTQ